MALTIAAQRRVSEFNEQDLTNTAWALATINQRDEQLFTALARGAERRLRDFNAQ